MHPILIRLGPASVSTYGACVAAAYLIGILWLKSQIPFMPRMSEDKFWTMIYGLFFGAIAGGKLLFVALEWRAYWSGELSFFWDFRYGFVFFGGLLGAIAMGFLVARWCDIPYLGVADYFGAALPMGHWLGRLGCLAAGCCYGRPTTLPWGVRVGGSPASSTPQEFWGMPLHPTQVYDALANVAIFVLLLYRMLPLVKKGKLPPGTVFLSYIFLYSVARFFIEFFRGDDRGGSFLGLFISQWIGLACLAVAAAMIVRLRPRLKPVFGL